MMRIRKGTKMAQEYKIKRVSEQEPRVWDGDYGTIYYIKVELEGHEKPVEIGKKDPKALKAGDTVYGDIKPSDYANDGFKSAKRPESGGGGYRRDDEAIRAQFAIKTAVMALPDFLDDTRAYVSTVEVLAHEFYALVDKVKGGNKEKLHEESKPEPVKKLKEDTVIEDIGDEPIDLSEIPF